VLSIDVVLQHLAERELDRVMSETRAAAASAVMLDPTTGEVLALANRPAPDANRFGRARPEARRNRVVVERFEPGSTFKIVPLAAALEAGKIHPDRPIFCENGEYRSDGRVIHDVAPHGLLTPEEILTRSSNIGMVKIAKTLTRLQLSEMISRFGFGERTGIELPGENRGLVRPPSQWSGFSLASLSFGQEIGVTALQLASAFAAVAHDGVRVPPRIVLGTRDPSGQLKRRPAPESHRVMRPATARAIASMLETAVEQGTGRRAAVPGYRVAGKSGTAQKPLASGRGYSLDEYVASFAGFAPAGAPRVVLLVVVDSPRGRGYYGGEVAAPVFARIMTEALRHLRVPADEPAAPPAEASESELLAATRRPARPGPPDDAPASVVELGPGLAPDVRGLDLRRAAALLAAYGCSTRVDGGGVVLAQDPAPGSPLAPGSACSIRLGRQPLNEPPPDAAPTRGAI
jgi:cell division protein FtsI (penicillin-binding protein 3)